MKRGHGHRPWPVEGRVVPAVRGGRRDLGQEAGPGGVVERAERPAGQVYLDLEVVLGS
jgi:hypothetical protein